MQIPRDNKPNRKIFSDMATLSKPLWDLLSKNQSCKWTTYSRDSFSKNENRATLYVSNSPILAPHNVDGNTKITVDALAYSLGAVIVQNSLIQNGDQLSSDTSFSMNEK